MSTSQTPVSVSSGWDVFLSFRGIDTRSTFTNHLYDALHRTGIRTFNDDYELPSGEELISRFQAIRESKTYIIVLSENYASSCWCLDELLEILSCCKTTGRQVIPVFYKIDPSIVRHQIGSFKEVFEKSLIHFGMEKVNEWRLALARVADFSGYHVSQNRSHANIINKVVDRVLLSIKPITLDFAKYPGRSDTRVDYISTLMRNDVSSLGIRGMSGVGKTALASTSPPTTWDVFLSFRGIDTRYTFTDHLCHALHRIGIRTFVDDPELRWGEVISNSLLQAINESKAYIVVFSENYASSSWCLDELVEIVGCYKSLGRLVVPVFYNIEPSTVRYQTGSFYEAFRIHETRYDREKLDKWQNALKNAANLSGYEVQKDMFQADIIDKVVDRVLLKINPMSLDVEKLFSLDTHVEDISTFMRSDREGVSRIGLRSKGRVGKTALASTSPPTTWDVFLSFRGIDTRYTFTDHLYHALHRTGIRTFKDGPELRRGEMISDSLLQALHESKSYVVVFSENYASSSWCLDELVEILDCCKTTGKLVIPVFYRIDPSFVRRQLGSYKEALENHLIRFEMEKVDEWRLALKEVADFSGHHVFQNSCRYEVDIINEIVDEILLKINPNTLYVAKYPVGLDARVKDITTLLSSLHGMGGLGKITLAQKLSICGVGEPEKTTLAKKIGIYGMGGVGKTTLAKAVYNENCNLFQGSCFLENVREVSRKGGLECLQQQLINNVLKRQNINIYNVDQGIELIRARICSIKVLIVIDDLDDPRQLEYLEGRFALGSIMIITTRNEDLLDSIEVESRYKVNELGDAESLQLFSLHAFGVNRIPETLIELSHKILQRAEGLPLVLEVLGSNLLNQCEEGMISFDESKIVSIDDVEKKLEISFDDVNKKLETSFDALKLVDPMLQDIFLDIACSFIGRGKKEVVEILDTYYSYVDHKIDILQKRCLLTINKRDEFMMHNLIRDMGRGVIRKNSPDDPGKHSRLWVSKDICNVLKNDKGTEVIEVIIHQNSYHQNSLDEVSFAMETFKRMSRLRFLHLDCVNLTGSFKQALEDLRWLCWDRCPLECLPSEFYPQKLVILELPHSKMRTMWELNMISQVFEKLKTLNMWKSLNLTSTPDFTKLPRLENLNLEGCESLKKVDVSIGSLVALVSLNLGGCVNLRSLPDSICNLGALESLNIVNCSGLTELPIELGNLGRMKELNAEGLTVSKIPDSIGRLSKLVELTLSHNKYLKTFPDTLYKLNSLEFLDISYCDGLEVLPFQLLKLTRLRELYAKGASPLNQLPQIESSTSALSLKKLYLSESLVTALPSGISQLPILEVLNLKGCRHLSSIPELPPTLKELRAEDCTSMLQLPNLSNLKHLEILDLTGCSSLAEIQGLEELTSLRELPLGGCNSSLMAYTFTKRFFQIYSGFGHEIKIYARSAEFPDWISQSSNLGSSVSLDLQPNVSQNFLGMILCFKYCEDEGLYRLDYTVKTTTSDFRCSYDGLYSHFYNESWMVIVPRSIFSVTDGDDRIELVANQTILGIHLLYKTGITMIEYDSTTGQVEDEKSYPSKRLKHFKSDN